MYKVHVADSQDDNNNEHECAHKDPKRMKEDQWYAQKFYNLFKIYNPFDRTFPDLVSITTGDIASEIVMNDLLHAEATGKQIVSEFVETRLIKKTTDF
jgi:hypothetical protein